MMHSRTEEIMDILKVNKRVYVNDLSTSTNTSKVTIRKYLAELENQGLAVRFHGGASLVENPPNKDGAQSFYSDPLRVTLAQRACKQITDGDSIFIGSGRSCCVLAREMTGFKNITVVTNNITALPDLYRNASRIYQIGGEVTSTDDETLFSSWETPPPMLKNLFVNKSFTSVSGIDLNAGLTVDSIMSTFIFKQIGTMAQYWYVIADSTKINKIALYKIADLGQIHALISDNLSQQYVERFSELNVKLM
jgi:DeoR/GlpR family transcriptional regulator of sugar metabolism